MDFVWTEKLAVGVREIDIQHKFLFAKINDLLGAMDSNDTLEHIDKFFVFLEEYAASHFAMEQKAMGVYKYPDMAAHIEQHNIFNRSINELKASFKESGVTEALSRELREKLCDWLVDHVSEVDRVLGLFLKPRARAL